MREEMEREERGYDELHIKAGEESRGCLSQ